MPVLVCENCTCEWCSYDRKVRREKAQAAIWDKWVVDSAMAQLRARVHAERLRLAAAREREQSAQGQVAQALRKLATDIDSGKLIALQYFLDYDYVETPGTSMYREYKTTGKRTVTIDLAVR